MCTVLISVWVVPSSVMRCACCGDKGCVYLAILRHVQCRCMMWSLVSDQIVKVIQKRVTMSLGSLRSVSKVVHLMHISKSSLGAVGCWHASLLDQDNVVDLMGEHKSFYIFSFVFSFVSSYSVSYLICFFYQIHFGRKRT